MTVDDVLDLALQTDDRAISVYEEVLQRGTPDSVTETFENLLDMEKNQEKRMVLQTARGDDL